MKWVTALVVCMGIASIAGAGTEVETKTREEANGKVSPGHAFFDGRRVRVDVSSGRRAFIYRGDEGLIWLVDHKKKDYLQVARPSAAGLAAVARSQLSNEQRAAVDMAAGIDPNLEIRETGTRSTVTGVSCQELQIHQGGRHVADICRASYADAGVSPATSRPHWMKPGYQSTTSRAAMMPRQTGTVRPATSPAFAPKILMPKGRATRNERKMPEKPSTFSSMVVAVTSTERPEKRAAS